MDGLCGELVVFEFDVRYGKAVGVFGEVDVGVGMIEILKLCRCGSLRFMRRCGLRGMVTCKAPTGKPLTPSARQPPSLTATTTTTAYNKPSLIDKPSLDYGL